jgi:hypothetical protein
MGLADPAIGWIGLDSGWVWVRIVAWVGYIKLKEKEVYIRFLPEENTHNAPSSFF